MAETFVQKQVRLVIEKQCRELADDLKAKVPAGVGFALFLFDFGTKGNVAYVSTADRTDMMNLLTEWMEREMMKRGINMDDYDIVEAKK